MADTKLILVCKDKPTLDDVVKILTASGKIAENEIEAWEEKTWDVKRKTGPIHSKILFIGDIKDTTSLGCFIDIKYERWGICYGVNSRYALITTDTMYIKDNARYKAFLDSYEDALGLSLVQSDWLSPQAVQVLLHRSSTMTTKHNSRRQISCVSLARGTLLRMR